METLEKKGKGSALLPFLLFIVIYLGAGLYFQAQGVEMAFYQFPSVTAMFIALLLAFCLILFASTYFFLGALALFLPVIWLYAFFDSYALRSQLAAGTAPEDAFLFGLSDMDSKRLGELLRKRHSLIGWALVVVGVYMLYDILLSQLGGLFFGWFGEWLYGLLRYGLPRLVITVLVILLGLAEECGIRPFLLGRGTNLLVSDRGLDTLVIKTAERMTSIRRLDDVTLEADAGVLLSRLAVYAQQAGLAGLEFAHGIPGSLGGAVCMNAGAYGGEMRQVVTEVTALYPDGIRRFTGDQAEFAYRHSRFLEDGAVVLGAVVRLTPDDPAAIRQRMDDLMARRRASQPLEWPSAGSTFKRPEGHFAGTLIDQCGLKGLTVGGAQVSEKHAGFLINRGGATFADMAELIRQVQQRVLEETGVTLEPEVKIVK